MTKSTFYHDGYRAGIRGADCSPPSVPVYSREYSDGYNDACLSLEPFPICDWGSAAPTQGE